MFKPLEQFFYTTLYIFHLKSLTQNLNPVIMINSGALAGRTIFISGASRGIGEAIAVKCARDGANVAIAAKTAEPHPKLPGTIYTVAEKIEAAGGKALPCVVDIRFVNFLFCCSIVFEFFNCFLVLLFLSTNN